MINGVMMIVVMVRRGSGDDDSVGDSNTQPTTTVRVPV